MRIKTNPHVLRLHTSVTLAILCLSASLSLPVRADDVITLELPSPPDQRQTESILTKSSSGTPQMPEKYRTPTARRSSRITTIASRGGFISRGQTPNEKFVGRLGQAIRTTSIYRARSTGSVKLSNAAAGTYVAIQAEEGNWYGILMADSSIGWLRHENVKLMEYQVVSTDASTSTPGTIIDYDYSDGLPSSRSIFFQGDPEALFREAYKYMGVPYHWGGNTYNGIDCSGFVHNIFAANGYNLPRHSSDQTALGLAIPKDQLQPGDRLYFGNAVKRDITHTGLYLGNGYFIHSSSGRHGVAVSQLSEPLFERIYICSRR